VLAFMLVSGVAGGGAIGYFRFDRSLVWALILGVAVAAVLTYLGWKSCVILLGSGSEGRAASFVRDSSDWRFRSSLSRLRSSLASLLDLSMCSSLWSRLVSRSDSLCASRSVAARNVSRTTRIFRSTLYRSASPLTGKALVRARIWASVSCR
jgi:hypothetical protein